MNFLTKHFRVFVANTETSKQKHTILGGTERYTGVTQVPPREGESMQLRDYQQECIDIIEQKPPGAYLVQMATGLGKTKTFTHLPRHGQCFDFIPPGGASQAAPEGI